MRRLFALFVVGSTFLGASVAPAGASRSVTTCKAEGNSKVTCLSKWDGGRIRQTMVNDFCSGTVYYYGEIRDSTQKPRATRVRATVFRYDSEFKEWMRYDRDQVENATYRFKDGKLRFYLTIPYSPDGLAALTTEGNEYQFRGWSRYGDLFLNFFPPPDGDCTGNGNSNGGAAPQ